MALVVGLGNPGTEYDHTRHNIGFRLIDHLAEKLSISFRSGKGPYMMGKGSHNGVGFYLLKPNTYMNRSGEAVRHAIQYYNTELSNSLVCYDDLNLPAGTLRLRAGGSAGGHNGIQNIIDHLGSNNFSRLRIGIGNDFRKGEQSRYVLSSFTSEQEKEIEGMLDVASDAILLFLRDGIESAMNNFN